MGVIKNTLALPSRSTAFWPCPIPTPLHTPPLYMYCFLCDAISASEWLRCKLLLRAFSPSNHFLLLIKCVDPNSQKTTISLTCNHCLPNQLPPVLFFVLPEESPHRWLQDSVLFTINFHVYFFVPEWHSFGCRLFRSTFWGVEVIQPVPPVAGHPSPHPFAPINVDC